MSKSTTIGFNVDRIRGQFPILQSDINNHRLVYFDNGATAQKPSEVIEAIESYYAESNANIHRGVHSLSQKATQMYEDARVKIQEYFNIAHSEEVIFTSGTTFSINLVAECFGKKYIQEGSEVIITTMEHHSNIVPWQMICEEKKATLKVVPISDKGELDLDSLYGMLSDKTAILSLTHVSNTLGTINPVKEIIQKAHEKNIPVLIDGAQAVPHMKVDVQDLDADFYAFSGHKMFGPTGIGVLYGKKKWLEDLPPYQGGGDMIKSVSFEKTEYNDLPHKFEAGTPNIAGGIGLGAAVDFMNRLDWKAVHEYENELLDYATAEISKIAGVRIIGQAREKASVLSFVIDGTHPYDIGTLLDQMGIAIRTGHHCTEPLMHRFEVPGTARASFAFYNTQEEVNTFINALNRAVKMLV